MSGFFAETVIKNPSLLADMRFVNQVEDLLLAVVQGVQYLDDLNGKRPRPVRRKEFTFIDNTEVDVNCTLGNLVDCKIESYVGFSIDDKVQRDEEEKRVYLLKKAVDEMEKERNKAVEDRNYEELKGYVGFISGLGARFNIKADTGSLYKAVEEIRDIAKRYSDLGIDEATAVYEKYNKVARKHRRFCFIKPKGMYKSTRHGLISDDALAKVIYGKDPDIKGLKPKKRSVKTKLKRALATAAVVGVAFAAGFGFGYKPVEQKPVPVVEHVEQSVIEEQNNYQIQTVKKGDTLWGITEKALGTTSDRETYKKCDEIAVVNGKGKQADHKVGELDNKNPHHIKPGDKIIIPADFTKGAFISGRARPALEMFDNNLYRAYLSARMIEDYSNSHKDEFERDILNLVNMHNSGKSTDVYAWLQTRKGVANALNYARSNGHVLERFCYDALRQDETNWLLAQYKNSNKTVDKIREDFTQGFGMAISTGSFYKVVDKLEKGCRRYKKLKGEINGI